MLLQRALEAQAEGWQVLPLPARSKASPPSGTTGRGKRFLQEEEVVELWQEGNYAISLPSNIIGLDFDLYRLTTGQHQHQQLVAEFGSLPATVSISSQEEPREKGFTSFYRVPEGFEAVSGVLVLDSIQHFHRYAVAPGSIHPSGRIYHWLLGLERVPFTPSTTELPFLPTGWLEGLALKGRRTEEEAVEEVLTPEDLSSMCSGMARSVQPLLRPRTGSRHDTMVRALWGLARQRSVGCTGFSQAARLLEEAWKKKFSLEESLSRNIGWEFASAQASAQAKNPVTASDCNCWQRSNRNTKEKSFTTRGLF